MKEPLYCGDILEFVLVTKKLGRALDLAVATTQNYYTCNQTNVALTLYHSLA
jgi:hypothetical protein